MNRLAVVWAYPGTLELLFRHAGTPVPARWNSCSGTLELFFRSCTFQDRKNIYPIKPDNERHKMVKSMLQIGYIFEKSFIL